MEIISPLKWHYPFIPFLNEKNEELLASPVPLLACVHEMKAMNGEINQNAGKDYEFYKMWTKENNQASIMHFNLDKNLRFGKLKVDLKKFLEGHNYYQQIKSARKRIEMTFASDYGLKTMYLPKHKGTVREVASMIKILQDIIQKIYFDNFDMNLLKSQTKQPSFDEICKQILDKSTFNKENHSLLLKSQAFQFFIDSNSNSTQNPLSN